VRERRAQASHPARVKPELIATKPNEVWSWDIVKLYGPAKWTYFYLYAVMDVYSRKAVGWMVATCETAALAEALLAETIAKERVPAEQLTIHSDNGTSMASKAVALLLADLGVTKSHSRPLVSNDNPYSEALFKTVKYCPAFPGQFATLTDARAFCNRFFDAYNHRRHGEPGSGDASLLACGPLVPGVWSSTPPPQPAGRRSILEDDHLVRAPRGADQAPGSVDFVGFSDVVVSSVCDDGAPFGFLRFGAVRMSWFMAAMCPDLMGAIGWR